MSDKKELKEVRINPNKILGTTYSQLVGVSVTDIDVTLEFVYINPRNASEGELVSRVTLPKSVAADLSSTINLTLKSHDKRISEKN